MLHTDYPASDGSLDQAVLDALELNREETLDFLRENLPTYLDFERRIVEQIGAVDRVKVEAFQHLLLHREHRESKRSEIHELTGCDRSISNGVLLNHLEDWRYAYEVAIVPRKPA